jgi:hypothetical protein
MLRNEQKHKLKGYSSGRIGVKHYTIKLDLYFILLNAIKFILSQIVYEKPIKSSCLAD